MSGLTYTILLQLKIEYTQIAIVALIKRLLYELKYRFLLLWKIFLQNSEIIFLLMFIINLSILCWSNQAKKSDVSVDFIFIFIFMLIFLKFKF